MVREGWEWRLTSVSCIGAHDKFGVLSQPMQKGFEANFVAEAYHEPFQGYVSMVAILLG